MITCKFCLSPSPNISHFQMFHKVDNTFGPFDLSECPSCGSLNTANPPPAERLGQFYRRYEDFRPDWYNSAASNGALSSQYRFYASTIARLTSQKSAWLDVGAGHGEVSNFLVQSHADGMAADIGPRPHSLSAQVEYNSLDMNKARWASDLPKQFDHVFSVAVWEHVLQPLDFARECMSLVAPHGTLTLICPDYGSLARKVLNRMWPYFEPGEHISIPTKRGARNCLAHALDELKLEADIKVSRLNVAYSLRYLFDVLRLKPIASAMPPDLSAPLPTGLLIANVVRR